MKAAADYLLKDLPFAVVDVETTTVGKVSRIVEIAIVKVNAAGDVLAEYDTLVNPQIPITTEWVHGISDADVRDAPLFIDIAQQVAHYLSGAIIVAHNAGFDMGMLAKEMARFGIRWQAPHVCTMVLRKMAGLPGPRMHKLSWACWQQAQPLKDAHRALHDTRATAGLTIAYLQHALAQGAVTLGDLAQREEVYSLSWKLPLLDVKPKENTPRKQREDDGVAPVWPSLSGEDSNIPYYQTLLGHHVNTNEVTHLNVETLQRAAMELSLSAEQLNTAHAALVAQRTKAMMAQGMPDEKEFLMLTKFASKLAVSHEVIVQAMRETLSPGEHQPGLGYVLCFAGRITKDGKLLSAAQANEMARRLGFIVKSTVTQDVHVVVADDIRVNNGKVAKARNYGLRVMQTAEFLDITR
jgi:DNA polymerase III epsilon subunit family exonuclease